MALAQTKKQSDAEWKPVGSGTSASLRAFAADIKLSHSVFALPFAAAALVIGAIPLPSWHQCLLLVVCMVTARSFAMGMNRVLDWRIDGKNPRTRQRQIPAGSLSPRQARNWSLAAAAVFIVAAASLSPLAGYMAVPLLVVLASYSLLKRWTWLTHWYLGICLGLAPVAVQVALTGAVSAPVLVLAAAVAFWTAGFDIMYSLQDLAFDREHGLRSTPQTFGPLWALWMSRFCFVAMIGLLVVAGSLARLGPYYRLGVAVVAMILAYEHVLVRDAKQDGKSKRMNAAFFNANAGVSIVFLVFVIADALSV